MGISFLTNFFGSKSVAEKRRETRLEAENQLGIDFQTGELGRISGQVSGKDISSLGIRFATFIPLKRGRPLQIGLEFPKGFPGTPKVTVKAEVIWVYRPKGAQRYRVACQFMNLDQSPEAATALQEFIWWLNLLDRGRRIQQSLDTSSRF